LTPLSASELAAIVGGRLVHGDANATVTGIAIDSRKLSPGDAFVAFKGEKVDGHTFVPQVIHQGAAAVLISRDLPLDELKGSQSAIIRIEDPLLAVQRLAAHERAQFHGPVVGVTGSNGKTTTKDMLAAVFKAQGPCLATEGNYNNELGLPLTLLRRTSEHRAIVLEMGMRGFGQIAGLCQIAHPTSGIIINIGHSHIELLGSQENIAKAKSELLEAIPQDGFAALQAADPWLRRMADRCRGRVLWYGLDGDTDAYATDIVRTEGGTAFTAHVLGHTAKVQLPTYGEHNVLNALGALLIGAAHGLPLADMAEQLAQLEPASGRLRIVRGRDGRTIIDDCYNASPLSMKASLRVLHDIAPAGGAVAILGDMFELGDYAEEGHREVGQFAAAQGVDVLVTIGPLARWIAEAAETAGCPQVFAFDQRDTAIKRLDDLLPSGSTVLVKASRGMQLEQVVQFLTHQES
jgi:UDP-N-acetylmuramoyl-tripeptide--D-alanyl-D-alanine ligase